MLIKIKAGAKVPAFFVVYQVISWTGIEYKQKLQDKNYITLDRNYL
jgi:hypothetical protein